MFNWFKDFFDSKCPSIRIITKCLSILDYKNKDMGTYCFKQYCYKFVIFKNFIHFQYGTMIQLKADKTILLTII